jgi:hypothetical protein
MDARIRAQELMAPQSSHLPLPPPGGRPHTTGAALSVWPYRFRGLDDPHAG